MKHPEKQKSTTQFFKPLLACSLLLNVAGIVAGIFLYHQSKSATPPPGQGEQNLMPIATQSPVQAKPQAVMETFHWSNLESEDYSIFIARLRDIGCPESTIRDIIQGEMTASYALKRKELEQQILHSSGWAPPVGMTRQGFLAAQFRKLDREVENITNAIIAASASSNPSDGAPNVTTQRSSARYPMVLGGITFQPAPRNAAAGAAPSSGAAGGPAFAAPGVIKATPEQIASIEKIQQQFVKDVGGPNQDPTDPEYEQKWKSAQWVADQIYKAKFGWRAYNDIVSAASKKAYEDSLQQSPATN